MPDGSNVAPPSVKELRAAGFTHCVAEDGKRPCAGALAFDPTHGKKKALCCGEQHRSVSVAEAGSCKEKA